MSEEAKNKIKKIREMEEKVNRENLVYETDNYLYSL